MKRFITAVAFCSFLLVAGTFLLVRSSSAAKEDVLLELLNYPAPPPPNPLVKMNQSDRPLSFYDKSKPPPDNAPIEDLIDYWTQMSRGYIELGFNPKPSAKVIDRLFEEVEKDPTSVVQFLKILPDDKRSAEIVKNIYDQPSIWADSEENGQAEIREWLKRNSPYFSDELARTAERAAETAEYITNQDDVLDLARVDWAKASPIVNKLYNSGQPVSRVLAQWSFYRNALATDSIGDIDRYRDELKAAVEDRTAKPGVRDLAFDALSKEKDWSGRDEWYYGLLEDETLADLRVNGSSYTGLTTLVIYSDPEKYRDKMIELLKSENITVRTAAAKNLIRLINTRNKDIIRALLPWLSDPKWIKSDNDGGRASLVAALGSVKLPESVPALLAALDEKSTREVEYNAYANSNSYTSNSAAEVVRRATEAVNAAANAMNRASNSSSGRTSTETYYPLRRSAIGALAMQGDMRAAGPLRRVLPLVEEYERRGVVNAIYKCGGFTVAEQADAIESYIKNIAQMAAMAVNAGANAANYAYNGIRPTKVLSPEETKNYLGETLLGNEEISEPLVRELIARITLLEKSDPLMAATLRQLFVRWKGTAVNALLLNDLKNNRTDAEAVVKLLSIRKELRAKQPNDIYDLRTGGATAIGISACLIESEADYVAILTGGNAEAKTAMLACARLIRAKLPVAETAANLNSTDKRLALAAERYLESEDSPEARRIVLSLHPNEAMILGATTAFIPDGNVRSGAFLAALFASVARPNAENNLDAVSNSDEDVYFSHGIHGLNDYRAYDSDQFNDVEERLRKEVKTDAELLGVYSYGEFFIRIFRDKTVFSWEEDESRFHERTLSPEEFEYFKGYLAHHRVDELAPFLDCNRYGCEAKQLLMLGKQGGRRVFVNASRKPEFFVGLEGMFAEMKRPAAKLKYALEKDVPGLEILFADENRSVQTIWKNGSDFRLMLVDDLRRKEIDKEIADEAEKIMAARPETDEEDYSDPSYQIRERRKFDDSAWFYFDGTKLGDAAPQPEQVEFLPARDSSSALAPFGQWKAKAAGIEIREDGEKGLNKISGGKATKIRDGNYSSPVITQNGRWVVASKFGEEGDSKLVRINLQTNKEFPVTSEDFSYGRPVAFVPAINKVLVNLAYYDHEEYEDSPGVAEYSNNAFFWLDPETGAVQPVTGEISPLAQQKFRQLQPAVNQFEFWAAIPNSKKNETNVGIYNSKTLTFKPVLNIPKIRFSSMDMWMDAPASKLYFVYNGHLLALPVK